jgi:hypothetical protein
LDFPETALGLDLLGLVQAGIPRSRCLGVQPGFSFGCCAWAGPAGVACGELWLIQLRFLWQIPLLVPGDW